MPDKLDVNVLKSLWDFADPEASETRIREALLNHDPDLASFHELQTQLARALGLQGRFDEASRMLDHIDSEEPRVQARVSLEHGRLLNSSGHPELAIAHFLNARNLAKAVPDPYLEVDALHMLAIVDREKAEHWFSIGLEIAERATDLPTRGWRGALLTNLAWTLHDAGEFEKALATFERARDMYVLSGTPDQVHIAWWSVARSLRSLNRLHEALDIQTQLAADDPPDEYVIEEIANLERLIG